MIDCTHSWNWTINFNCPYDRQREPSFNQRKSNSFGENQLWIIKNFADGVWYTQYGLITGSSGEVPWKYCLHNLTDMDAMIYNFEICAIPRKREPPRNFKGTVLEIDSSETPPGYARLKVRTSRPKRQGEPIYYRRPFEDMPNEITFGPSMKLNISFSYLLDKDMNEESFQFNPSKGLPGDLVSVVYCPYWPNEAEEWRSRKRSHGWPDEKLIARIPKGGCHFVSKLREESNYDNSEWRFSFSKAELLLIHSWTAVHYHVYHLIKVIKKKITDECDGDRRHSLHTYYFKTLMLWACEENPPEFWTESTVESCVCDILGRMIKSLKDRRCSNYFIPAVNLMSHLANDRSIDLTKEITFLGLYTEEKVTSIASDWLHVYLKKPSTPFCANEMLERLIANGLNSVFPLNEKLNGRLGEHLCPCDWFLPKLKFLHSAIEANLRLMTIDSISQRIENENVAVCLKNFRLAMSPNKEIKAYEYLNIDLSLTEIINRVLLAKLSGADIKHEYAPDTMQSIDEMFKMLPSPPFVATTAYEANFYFTALRSYHEAFIECKNVIKEIEHQAEINMMKTVENDFSVPILVTNSLSSIFDEHIQVILGFVSLHKFISSESTKSAFLFLRPLEFMRYLYFQCRRKVSNKNKKTNWCVPEMWELTKMAFLGRFVLNAALRQSGADSCLFSSS